MHLRRYLPVAAVLAMVVLVQLAVTAAGATYYLTQLTMAAYYSLVVIGLCLLMGYAGQISLGHAGFFAIGGYASALLSTMDLSGVAGPQAVGLLKRLHLLVERQDLYGHLLVSFAPWLAFLCAMALTAAAALIIGIPVIRLRGHYLAMATLGFGLIVWRVVLGTGFLGSADGITSVPAFPLPAGLEVSGKMGQRVSNYYIAWVLVAVVVALSVNLLSSRVGRALRSIHGAEEAANAMGVNTSRYKLYTFVLSALLAGLAGVFLTHYNGGIGPTEATVTKSVRYVAIVAIGGMANLWGALAMAAVLSFLSLRGVFGTYDDAFFAGVLIAIMLFFPEGLLRREILRGGLSLLKRAVSALPRRLAGRGRG